MDAFTVQSVLGETFRPNSYGAVSLPGFKPPGKNPYLPEKVRLFDSGWAEADRATLRRTNINKLKEIMEAGKAVPDPQGGPVGYA